MPADAERYVVTLDVDVAGGEARVQVWIYDGDVTVLAYTDDRWTTFCWTWKDLADLVEDRWRKNGGQVNGSLTRPSPFVDLT